MSTEIPPALLLHELFARLARVKQLSPRCFEAAEAALHKFTAGSVDAETASAAVAAAFAEFPAAQRREIEELLAFCNPGATTGSLLSAQGLSNADHLLSTTTADSDDTNTATFGPSHVLPAAAFPDVKSATGWPPAGPQEIPPDQSGVCKSFAEEVAAGGQSQVRPEQQEQQSISERVQKKLEVTLGCAGNKVGQQWEAHPAMAAAVRELSVLATSKGWTAVDACLDLIREWKAGRATPAEVRMVIGASDIVHPDRLPPFLAAVTGILKSANTSSTNDSTAHDGLRRPARNDTGGLLARIMDLTSSSSAGQLSYLHRQFDGVLHHSSGAATLLPTDVAAQVNRTYVSISRGSEDFIVPYLRRNLAEEAMFASEDALFEIDVAVSSTEALANALSNPEVKSLMSSAVHLRSLTQVLGDSAEDVVQMARCQPSAVLAPLQLLVLERLSSLKQARSKLLKNQILTDMERCYYRQFDGVSFHTAGVDKCMLTVEGLCAQAQLLHLMNRPFAPVPPALLKTAKSLFRRLLAATGGGFPGCPNVTRAAAVKSVAQPPSATDTAASASPVTVEWSESGLATPILQRASSTADRLTLETAVICTLGLHVDEPFGQDCLREWTAKRDNLCQPWTTYQPPPPPQTALAITSDTVGVDLEYDIDLEDHLHRDLIELILERFVHSSSLPVGTPQVGTGGGHLTSDLKGHGGLCANADLYLLRHIFTQMLKLKAGDSVFQQTLQKSSKSAVKVAAAKDTGNNVHSLHRISHISTTNSSKTNFLKTATIRSYITYLTPPLYALLRLYVTAYDRLRQLRSCLEQRRDPKSPEAQLAWGPEDTDVSKRLTWKTFFREVLLPSSGSGSEKKSEAFETALRLAVGVKCPSMLTFSSLLATFAATCGDALAHAPTWLVVALNAAYDDSECASLERRAVVSAIAQKAKCALMVADMSCPGKIRFSVIQCEAAASDGNAEVNSAVSPNEIQECDYIMHRMHSITIGGETIHLRHAARFATVKAIIASFDDTSSREPSERRSRKARVGDFAKKRAAATRESAEAAEVTGRSTSPPRTRLRATRNGKMEQAKKRN